MDARKTVDRILEIILNKNTREIVGEANDKSKIELAQMKTVDGRVIEAETFEVGMTVWLIDSNAQIPLPVGEYEVEGGAIIVVTTEGIIAEIREAPVDEPATAEPAPAEEAVMAEKVEGEQIKTAFSDEQRIELKSIITEVMNELQKDSMQAYVDEMQKDIDTKFETHTTTVADKDKEIETLKTQLNEVPASDGITVSPEGNLKPITMDKPQSARSDGTRRMSAFDRVAQRLWGEGGEA